MAIVVDHERTICHKVSALFYPDRPATWKYLDAAFPAYVTYETQLEYNASVRWQKALYRRAGSPILHKEDPRCSSLPPFFRGNAALYSTKKVGFAISEIYLAPRRLLKHNACIVGWLKAREKEPVFRAVSRNSKKLPTDISFR